MTDVRDTCSALARQLNKAGCVYAIVGGAACQMFGSGRTTKDVDIVVRAREVPKARSALRAAPNIFTIEPGTLHTSHGTVYIDILSPPTMWRGQFDESTATVQVSFGGIQARVLHPLLLLNNKCGAIWGRSEDKMYTDYEDIIFLLRYCVRNGLRPTANSVPNAGDKCGNLLMEEYGDEDAWIAAGYDKRLGEPRFAVQCADNRRIVSGGLTFSCHASKKLPCGQIGLASAGSESTTTCIHQTCALAVVCTIRFVYQTVTRSKCLAVSRVRSTASGCGEPRQHSSISQSVVRHLVIS